MLTLHHLHIAQSERIVWLLEELQIPYRLVTHTRAPAVAPSSLKKLPGNDTGKAPFLEDSAANVKLSESGAIAEYIIQKYGQGRLAAKPEDAYFADYLFWFHNANSNLQSAFATSMFIDLAQLPASETTVTPIAEYMVKANLKLLDERLQGNKWLAGHVFTAADIMSIYPVTTQRYFGPQVNLKDYPNILRWIRDCSERPAYKAAMEKGDPEMKLLLGPEAPKQSLLVVGGAQSDVWKKARI